MADRTTLATLGLYLGATTGHIFLLGRPWPAPRLALARRDVGLALGLALLYLTAAAYFGAIPSHFHFDEFITAYTSVSLPRIERIDWFAGYPDVGQWVCQFPILFFALQKPFLAALGPSVASVRISTWPYLALTAVYLYALAGRYVGSRPYRALAVVAFVVLAPNLYLASMGVHFSSSVLFLVAGVYHYERATADGSRAHAALCGLWLGLCFLTYSASFLALPLLLVFVGMRLLARRDRGALVLGGRIFGTFAAVMLPFGFYAATRDDYFTQRPGQVGFAVAAAATSGEAAERIATLWELLREALLVNVRSVYEPGIGGVTDYNFGHQALLDPPTLVLLGLGAAAALWRAWRGRDDTPLRPLVVVLLGFLFGMVLTQPAGAFHRLVVVFPFIGLLVAMGLEWIGRRKMAVAAVGGVALALANLAALNRMVELDGPRPSVAIAQYLQQHVAPGAEVVIAADPVFHLQRELYFRTGGRYRFSTDWFTTAERWMDGRAVIVYAPEPWQVEWLEERLPEATFVDTIDGRPLEKYLLVLPEPT